MVREACRAGPRRSSCWGGASLGTPTTADDGRRWRPNEDPARALLVKTARAAVTSAPSVAVLRRSDSSLTRLSIHGRMEVRDTLRNYPDELRERAVLLAVEARCDPITRAGALRRPDNQLGTDRDKLRNCGQQADVDAFGVATRPGAPRGPQGSTRNAVRSVSAGPHC